MNACTILYWTWYLYIIPPESTSLAYVMNPSHQYQHYSFSNSRSNTLNDILIPELIIIETLHLPWMYMTSEVISILLVHFKLFTEICFIVVEKSIQVLYFSLHFFIFFSFDYDRSCVSVCVLEISVIYRILNWRNAKCG